MAKFRCALVFCFLLTCFTAARANQSISVTQSIDRTEIAFEERVNFEILLQWKGHQASYRFDKPLSPYFDRLKIERFSSTIESKGSGADEITTKTFKYSLQPTTGGIGKIDPVTISYVSWPDSIPGELVTEAITINIAQPIPKKTAQSGRLWYWLLGSLLLIIVILLAVLRPWRKKESIPVKTAAEEMLEGLEVLKNDAASDFKRYQNGLLKLLMAYLGRYEIYPDDYTKEKLTEQISKIDLSDQKRERIVKWIIKANEDKFKPVTPTPGELVRLQTEVTDFFKEI